MKSDMRRLETLGKPVVAALNGTALGGGLEVALVAHHRIAADLAGTRIGLPEVSLGLLPGGGGISRVVRMLGLQKALSEVILPATKFTVQGALEVGLVDEVVSGVVDSAAPRGAEAMGPKGLSAAWRCPNLTSNRREAARIARDVAQTAERSTDASPACGTGGGCRRCLCRF